MSDGGLRSWGRRLTRSGVRRDVSALWLAQLAIMATTAVKGVLVARWLGSRDYGVTVLVLAYPAVVYALVDARTAETSLRYLTEFRAKGDDDRTLAMAKTSYLIDGSAGAVSAVVTIATSWWAARTFVSDPATVGLVSIVAVALFFRSAVGTGQALFASHGRLPAFAALQATTSIVRSAIVFVCAVLSPTVTSVVWANAAGMVVEGVVFLGAGSKMVRDTYGRRWTGASLSLLRPRRREMVRFVAYADLSSLIATVTKQIDVFVLGYLRGPTEVGYYGLARSIGTLPGYAVAPLQAAVYPRFARLHALSARDDLRHAVRRAALFVGLPLAGAGLVAVPFVPMAVRALAGREFAPAGPAAQLLAISSLTWGLCFWLRPLLLSFGRVRFLTAQNAVTAVVATTAFFVFVPRHGVLAMAWTQMAVGLAGFAAGAAFVLTRPELRAGDRGDRRPAEVLP